MVIYRCDSNGQTPLHIAAQCTVRSLVGPLLTAAKQSFTETRFKAFVNRLSKPKKNSEHMELFDAGM